MSFIFSDDEMFEQARKIYERVVLVKGVAQRYRGYLESITQNNKVLDGPQITPALIDHASQLGQILTELDDFNVDTLIPGAIETLDKIDESVY